MASIHGSNYRKPSLGLNFLKNKSSNDIISEKNLITISRPQSNYKTTYIGSDGLIKYADSNEPRFEYDSVTGESLGLLIEESRKNYLINSDDFTKTPWFTVAGTQILTKNDTVAPDGKYTGTKITNSYYGATSQNVSLSGFSVGTQFIFSLFIKKVPGFNYNQSGLGLRLWSRAVQGTETYDTFTDILPNLKASNGEWIRVSHTMSFVQNGTVSFSIQTGTGAPHIQVYVWGAQVEQGSFLTSYIPTSNATVTRSADVVSMSASGLDTGTFFARYKHQPPSGLDRQIFAIGSDNAYSALVCRTTPTGNANIVLPGVTDIATTSNSELQNQYNNVAIVKQPGNYAVCLNGGTVAKSNLTQTNSIKDYLTFMYGPIGSTSGGHISDLIYYPTNLTDKQLQYLTK